MWLVDLQQTPDSAAKVILRIFEKPSSGEGDPVPYSFQFNSPDDPRAEANAIKDLLSRLLAEIRSGDSAAPRPLGQPSPDLPGGNDSGNAAADSAASVRWYDDSQLLADGELQMSLMKKDKNLAQIYMNALHSKAESTKEPEFLARFWSTRINLLRAHAIETHQKKGAYNVLSAVKPRTVDGELKLNISVEQVQMIWSQHPLVKRIYNENVPRISEGEFWSRFFLSKLSKRLRGERVSDNDTSDALFDKYNEADDTIFSSKIMSSHVPHVIDLEGNEENQGGFRGGNRKDVEMRPRTNFPVIKTLNSLSEKIMANVAPSDHDPTVVADEGGRDDDGIYQELTLRDLRGDAGIERTILNVKEQSQFFSNQNSAPSADAQLYARQVPSEVLFEVQADVDTLEGDGAGGIDLHTGIGVDEDSDSDEDTQRTAHVGSRAARQTAQKQILRSLKRRRAEAYGHGSDESSPMGIPSEIAQMAYITNATTTEFLKQFWNAFLSGNPERAMELANHVESLRKSMARIEAVAEEAEQARDKIIEEKREEIVAHFKRTGRKIKWRADNVGGGKKAVLVLLGPTINGLRNAQNQYQAALAAEGITDRGVLAITGGRED